MLIADETIETASAWEWKIPLGLMIFGLPILVIHGLAIEGARGSATVLLASASCSWSTCRSRLPRCSSPRPWWT